MHIKYQIERFRSIVEQQEVILYSNKINIIIGKNGSGKSNFLEAISWFSGGKINNPKNLRTRKTEFHPDFNGINNAFLDEPEIIYDDELSKSEEEKIFSYLDSIGINLEIKKLTRHFSKYKDLFYKDLYINKNDLTHLSIIQKKIFLKFQEMWPNNIFLEQEINNCKYFSLNTKIDEAKKEINNSTKKGFNKTNKDLLCKALDVWVEIENIFKFKPNTLFSNDLQADNNILFEYPIQSVENMETIDPTFKKILNMFGSNTITEIKEIIDLSTSTHNRSIMSSLKTKIKIRAEKYFKNIFSNFDLNAIPEISIDDQMFQIKIKGNDKRYYGTSETIYQSSGFKAFFWLVIMLEIIKDWNKNKLGRTILLIDEPDKSLHILLQYELTQYLKSNFLQENLFIVLTTHSPFLIPNLNENIYIADINDQGCTKIIKAENVKNITNSSIFPLITSFHMEKLQNELFPNLNNKTNIYYEKLNNEEENIKLIDTLKNLIGEKINYQLIDLSTNDSKYIKNITSNNFFSRHISEIDEFHEIVLLKNNYNEKQDIFLTQNILKAILSDDIIISKK